MRTDNPHPADAFCIPPTRDALRTYDQLTDEYIHQVIAPVQAYVFGNVHTNSMENYSSLLKRTLKGTYVSVELFHLFLYLDEQAYRFNRRKGNDRQRFLRVVKNVSGKRLSYY